MSGFNPAKTGNSRVFIIEGRARPDHKPAYQSSMRAGGVSQGFGDITKIEAPSATEFGKFVEIGSIRGEVERVSLTLTGRYALDLKSELLRMANAGCAVDLQINFGSCTNPTDYNTFKKKVVLENAFLTNFETEDLGAIGSDELAAVNESADISATRVYELVEQSWAERGGAVIVNEVVDLTRCDSPSCGDCETESDGCNKFIGVTVAAGGSPATTPDVVFTTDAGLTWYSHDIDSITGSEDADGVRCMGVYVVVVSEGTESLHYALKEEFDGVQDPTFAEVTTGFVAGGGPRAIDVDPDGQRAFLVGAGGYIYYSDDPTAGVTVADAGALFPLGTFNAVSALTDEFAVAVGNGGIIAKTENGLTWAAVSTTPVGVGVNLNTVAVKSTLEWWIGASNGNLYYTLDGGQTWTVKAFPGSGSGAVEYVHIANETVMFLSHTTTAPLGRILKSTNGGYDWVVMPEGSGSLPANDRVNAVVACGENPDVAVGAGLADNGTDGFAIVATD